MKIGQSLYARRGFPVTSENSYIIMGRPTMDGEKWVTIAPVRGGSLESYPPEAFDSLFYKVDG